MLSGLKIKQQLTESFFKHFHGLFALLIGPSHHRRAQMHNMTPHPPTRVMRWAAKYQWVIQLPDSAASVPCISTSTTLAASVDSGACSKVSARMLEICESDEPREDAPPPPKKRIVKMDPKDADINLLAVTADPEDAAVEQECPTYLIGSQARDNPQRPWLTTSSDRPIHY